MVHIAKVTTKAGDGGESRLADGSAWPKDHAVFQAIGSVDECNSAIGVACVHPMPDGMHEQLRQIQNDLFDLGADLATPIGVEWEERATRLQESCVTRLESWIEAATEPLQALKSFILPGGSAAAAHLHLARAISRRTERTLIAAWPQLPDADKRQGRQPLIYVNRLSDYLFQSARRCNDNGATDVLWQPGGSPELKD